MKITRKKLAELIEEAMCGAMPAEMYVDMEMDSHGHEDRYDHGGHHGVETVESAIIDHKGTVSKEDCCAAVLCLIECCSCPATRAKLAACCAEIMAGHHSM